MRTAAGHQERVARPVLPGRANDRAASGPDKTGPATHEESALQHNPLPIRTKVLQPTSDNKDVRSQS